MISLICLKCNEELLDLDAAEIHDCPDTGEIKSDVDRITLESFPKEEHAFDEDRNKLTAVYSNPMHRQKHWQMYGVNSSQKYGSTSWLLNTQSYLQNCDEKISFRNGIQIPQKAPNSDLMDVDKFSQSPKKLYENNIPKIYASTNTFMSNNLPEDEVTSTSSNIQINESDRNILNSFSKQSFLPNEQHHSYNRCNAPNDAFPKMKQNIKNEGLFKNWGIDREQKRTSDNPFGRDKLAQNCNFPCTGLSLANSTTSNGETLFNTVQISKGDIFSPSHDIFDGISSKSNVSLYQDETSNDSFSSDSLTVVERHKKFLRRTKFETKGELALLRDTVQNNDKSHRYEPGEKTESVTLIPSGASHCDQNSEGLVNGNIFMKHHPNTSTIKSSQNPFHLDQSSQNGCPSIHEKKPSRKRLYQCTECKMILDESVLVTHKRLHMEEKRLKHNECPETLVKIQDLTKDPHKSKCFTCKECLKTFPCAKNFSRHKRIHSGEKPYECNECHRAFNQKNNLSSHKRLHTGTKPFECSKCLKKFSRKYTLERHTCV